MRVEIGRAQTRAIVRHPLIDSRVNADRLLGAQRRIAEARETNSCESSLPEPFEQRRRPKTIADMRPQFSVRRANKVGNRSIASDRILWSHSLQKPGTIRGANSE